MDLFDRHRETLTAAQAPLADRLRPRTLDEFAGQEAIVGPGRLLRRAIEADRLSSLIFFGPPGTGKTTLARIIANTTRARFVALNAVLSGVKDLRAAIDDARDRLGQQSQRTILFIDEVHRFNKAQQDALLPWVENGTVTLIGATTENPYFEVNKALVSRSRLFQLKSLDGDALRQVARQALADRERGYGDRQVELAPEALDHWVTAANGDARALLNALELAVETTDPDPDGTVRISLAIAEDSIQQRAVLYDKEGDAHFDTISAFIKSVRGSDPDAALYWLARMVYAGEDPRFILRRLAILAGEDVGLADPQAIAVVMACAAAFDRVGLPEGHYPLAQATLYLAVAPKSNSVMGFFDALAAVQQEQVADVPAHLKDNHRDKALGHGAGYRYPHAYREHWVAQQYLPAALQGQAFYRPSDRGYEAQIADRVARQREAQLAAALDGTDAAPLEALTFSPEDPARDRWLQRTLSQAGEQLGRLRDRLFAAADLQRHHAVLDANAGSGLLTWEAVRRVPEGGAFAWARTEREGAALAELAADLPELQRPAIGVGSLAELDAWLDRVAPGVAFDCILGRNLLGRERAREIPSGESRPAALPLLAARLAPGGRLVLAEAIPRRAQRLYRWLDWVEAEGGRVPLPPDLRDRLAAAEEAIYSPKTQNPEPQNPEPQNPDPAVAWDLPELEAAIAATGLAGRWELETVATDWRITPALLARWFPPDRAAAAPATGDRQPATRPRSYAERLGDRLSPEEVAAVRDCFWQVLRDRVVPRTATVGYLRAERPPSPPAPADRRSQPSDRRQMA